MSCVSPPSLTMTSTEDSEVTYNGWAKVISSLKSFLETGRPLGTLL